MTGNADRTERAVASVLDGAEPLFIQIKRAVARQILGGERQVGDRLPSEEQLATLYGVSRQTVNKAIALLAREGFLVRRRRAGTFVATGRYDRFALPIEDIGDIIGRSGGAYECRILTRKAVRNNNPVLWPNLPANAPLLLVECLHLRDGTPVQFEYRLVNLDAVPDIATAHFETVSPAKWLRQQVPWSSAEHTVHAINPSSPIGAFLKGRTEQNQCIRPKGLHYKRRSS